MTLSRISGEEDKEEVSAIIAEMRGLMRERRL